MKEGSLLHLESVSLRLAYVLDAFGLPSCASRYIVSHACHGWNHRRVSRSSHEMVALGSFVLSLSAIASVLAAPGHGLLAESQHAKRLFGLSTWTSSSGVDSSVPSGTTLVYTALTAIAAGVDKLSTTTLGSYSNSACQALCAQQSGCVFFNIYNVQSWSWFSTSLTPTCATYSSVHSIFDATDFGSANYQDSQGFSINAVAVKVTSTSSAKVATTSSSSTAVIKTSSTTSTRVVTTSSSSSSIIKSSSSAAAVAVATPIAAVLSTSSLAPVATPIAAVLSTSLAPVATPIAAVLSTSSLAPMATPIAAVISTSSLAAPVAAATTAAVKQISSVVATTSSTSSAACSLPTWAFSGWCQTTDAMMNQIKTNALNPASLSKGFIIPLYIYPSWWTTPGAWDWVYNAAVTNPLTQFTVIVNPASGPGSTIVPNSDYQHEIARLNAVSNIALLGYVDTAYGSRDAAAVASDISIYAGWGASNVAWKLDGIYFDNQASGSNYINLYSSYASQVRANAGFNSPVVGFGPGGVCAPGFVDLADFVVVFENASSQVEADLFGWYQSFVTGLSPAQLTKIAWMVNSVDSGSNKVMANLQAAFNSKYLYFTDNTGSWGAAFQSPISASTLSSMLSLISSPLTTTF